MSFDLFFQPCRFTRPGGQHSLAAASGVSQSVRDQPLSVSELRSVQKVLSRYQADGPDANGSYLLQLADGGAAEVIGGSDLERGCMVAVRALTRDLIQFVFDLLDAGKWVVMPAMPDTAALTTSPISLDVIPEGFPRVVVIKSSGELEWFLSNGFESFEKYRAQVRGQGE